MPPRPAASAAPARSAELSDRAGVRLAPDSTPTSVELERGRPPTAIRARVIWLNRELRPEARVGAGARSR